MARPLAVLCESGQGLVDEVHVVLVDVETEQAETPGGAAADAVQKLQSLTHKILRISTVGLGPQVILQSKSFISCCYCENFQCFKILNQFTKSVNIDIHISSFVFFSISWTV